MPNDNEKKSIFSKLTTGFQDMLYAAPAISEEPTESVTETIARPTPSTIYASSSTIDPKMLAAINGGIQNYGKEYVQFLDMVQDLKETIPDEIPCFKTALIALKKSQGFSLEKITLAIEARLEALKIQEEEFDRGLADKSSDVDVQETDIKNKETEITRLKEQIAELETEKQKTKKTVDESRTYFKTVKNNFQLAIKSVENKLNTDKTKIERYLKGGTNGNGNSR